MWIHLMEANVWVYRGISYTFLMFITPLSFRSATAWLNISKEVGLDWYLDVVEVDGKGFIGAA